jgi:hypothetical protein
LICKCSLAQFDMKFGRSKQQQQSRISGIGKQDIESKGLYTPIPLKF